MCGLAGLIGGKMDERAWRRVAEMLARRGPDASRLWSDGADVALFHARLRVVDLSLEADQPMEREFFGMRLMIAFNGEVYNCAWLRAQLEADGAAFRTRSDTEVLLAGFARWGEDVFRRARGMWAAAIWNPAERRLVLARDPLGKKPLFYSCCDGAITFASTLRALLALSPQTPRLSSRALDAYLGLLYVPPSLSIFEGVRKVPPGSVVSWRQGDVPRVATYWEPPPPDSHGPPFAEAAGEIERLLRAAIRRRLESDVPLGIFLSAGVDSGLVAALAAQESGARLVAVCAGTKGHPSDERSGARLVANRCGLDFREVELPPLSAGALPGLIADVGEPFGDSSLVSTYAVANAARAEMTVALTGDGGDEGFFGYRAFTGVRWAARWRRCVPAPLRRLAVRATDGWRDGGARQAAATLLRMGAGPLADNYVNRMGFSARDRAALLRPEWRVAPPQAEAFLRDLLLESRHCPDVDALRRAMVRGDLPGDYLVKVDSATMAASLEARCPFLDRDLLDFVLRVPPRVSFFEGRRKALLWPLVNRLLPEELRRRPKTGFSPPLSGWFRGPLIEPFRGLVLDASGTLCDAVDPSVAARFLEEHRRGWDHATRLWGLLALAVWWRIFVDCRAPEDVRFDV